MTKPFSTLTIAALLMAATAADRPPARSGAVLVRDASDGSLLLYGGHATQGAPADDTAVVWRWFAGTWQSIAPTGGDGPGARADMVVGFDAARGRLIVAGGQPGPTALGDVWAWRSGTWSRIGDDAPGGRHLAGGAFDPVRGELLLVGGHDLGANVMRHDTWLFGTNGWRAADTSRVLGSRFAMGVAWDPTRREIVLHGGHTVDGGPQHDTWGWNGVAWHRITSDGPTIPAHNALVADPLGRGLLLISSPGDPVRGALETWLLEGNAWRRLAVGGPTPRGGHALVLDPVGRRVVLFGGESSPRDKFNDLWQFDGAAWSMIGP